MKRKITLVMAIMMILCLLTGCGNATQAQVDELNAKLEEAETIIENLSLQVESANQQLDKIKAEAEDTIARLQATADASGLVLKEVGGIKLSGVKYQTTYTDIPFYATANEAKTNVYNMGYDTKTSFSIDGLDKATDVVVTIITSKGSVFDTTVELTPDNTYVFAYDFIPGVYTIEISYKVDNVQTSIYFAPQFDY